MDEIIFVVTEDLEGGYVARALGHAIFTEAENEADLRQNVRDAVKCHFDDNVKRVVRLHFTKDELLTI